MPEGRVVVAESTLESAPWTFVVGRAFLAAVPAGAARSVVHRLTEWIAEPDVQLESLIALLPVTGPDLVPSFLVIVPVRSGATDAAAPRGRPGDGVLLSVVARGDVVADVFSVGGARRFHDRGIRPWLLADFRSVTGIVIGSAAAPMTAVEGPVTLGRGRPVVRGTVTGGSLFWDPAAVDSGGLADARAEARAGANTHDVDPDDADPLSDTVLSLPGGPAGGMAAHLIGDTVLVVTATGPWQERGTGLLQQTGPAPDPPRRSFRLASGTRVTLDQVYYLGRNPRLPRIVRGPSPVLLPVPAPTRAVSSTHLEIRQDGASVVVTDLGSTNGTFVTPVNGRTRRLRAGQSLAVVPGTVVDIGDGNLIEILG